MVRDIDDSGKYARGVVWICREDVRSTFMRARDMAAVSQVWWWWVFWAVENLSEPLRRVWRFVRKPWS